jgi:hypothetical protein
MSTADLLAMLRGQGFTVAVERDRIRVAPASWLTAELRKVIRSHRAELLAALNVADGAGALNVPAEPLPADPAALQARLAALTADPAWADRWRDRLKAGRYADLDAVRRTVADLVSLAGDRHCAGDAGGFHSWCRFALDYAAGRHWDEAACRPVARPRDREPVTADEAGATFAAAGAIRHRKPTARFS